MNLNLNLIKCSKSLMILSLVTRDPLEARRRIAEPFAQQNSYDFSGISWLQRAILVALVLGVRTLPDSSV